MEDSAVTEPHKAESILRLGRSRGWSGGLKYRSGPWTSGPPASLCFPGAGTQKMLPPAGACIDGEWAVTPAGNRAKPLIIHPPHPRLPLPIFPLLSTLLSWTSLTDHVEEYFELEGSVSDPASPGAPGLSPAQAPNRGRGSD